MTIDAKRDLANISAGEFACRKRFKTPNVGLAYEQAAAMLWINFKERRPPPTDDGGRTRRGALSLAFSRGGRASTA